MFFFTIWSKEFQWEFLTEFWHACICEFQCELPLDFWCLNCHIVPDVWIAMWLMIHVWIATSGFWCVNTVIWIMMSIPMWFHNVKQEGFQKFSWHHVPLNTYIYAHINTYEHEYNQYIQICIHAYIHTPMYTLIRINTLTCLHACVKTDRHTDTHTGANEYPYI